MRNDEGCLLRPLDDWDFLWVDCGDLYDLAADEEVHRARPYFGATVYPTEQVLFMLRTGVATLDHVAYGLRTSKRVPMEKVRVALDLIGDCYAVALDEEIQEEAMFNEERKEQLMKAHRKMLVPSLIGIWGKPDRGFLTTTRSRF